MVGQSCSLGCNRLTLECLHRTLPMHVTCTRSAGIPQQRLPLSRLLPSFMVTLQLLYAAVYLTYYLPRWRGMHSPGGLLLALLVLTLPALHFATAWTDPGYIQKPGEHA